MNAIKRFFRRHNPYFRLKACQNELRLMIEENQMLHQRLANMERSMKANREMAKQPY